MKQLEEKLNILGTILIAIGWITGGLFLITFFIDNESIYLFMTPGVIISGYMSGYIFKGISRIIELLKSSSSFQDSKRNQSTGSFAKVNEKRANWDEIAENLKK